eukprot:TRINITY_DN1400_c0_g4_i1.p1 TRINITY_DN1400_c0_g4~~TRINITY_DN1400_c0_g4_i1.p1  ORF type:complete len:416 (+),score=40.91 TRINITY_DN1400_c0_g4_i1:120-1367(+)
MVKPNTDLISDGEEFPFQLLPLEIFIKIWSYFSIKDVFNAAAVNKWWQEFSGIKPVWEPRAKIWGMGASQIESASKKDFANAHNQYLIREKQRIAAERARKHAEEKEALNRKKQADAAVASERLKMTIFSRVSDYITIVLVLAGFLFPPLKLDQYIQWPWAVVLIPWYLLMLQVLVIVGLYDTLYLYYRRHLSIDAGGYSLLFWKLLFRVRIFRDLLYCGLFNFSLFFTLMAIKLTLAENDNDPYGWWAVWIPLWIFLIYFLQLLFTGGVSNSVGSMTCSNCCERILIFLGVTSVSFPLLLFIFLKMQGELNTWRLWVVFVPFWIVFGVLACTGIFFAIFFCCDRGGLTTRELAIYYIVIFAFFAAPICWFITFSLQSENRIDTSWTAAFTPLIFWAAGTLVGCSVGDIYWNFIR